MSECLRSIAARYASALKASEKLTGGGGDRPSAVDIWLWKLEEVPAALVENWKSKQRPEHPGRYDHHYLYAHRYCLNSKEDVQNAPDSVLFEMMGLSPSQESGWLAFMVRELGWHSMIAANWGLPVLRIPDGVTYDTTTEAQRRAQAVTYYLALMRERDPLAEVRNFAESMKARFRERHGGELGEEEFTAWLKRRRPWIYFLYAYGDKPNPPELLTTPGEPKYVGEHRTQLAAEIFAASARRRRNYDGPHSLDCLQRERERRREEGLAAEKRHAEETLQDAYYSRRAAEVGVVPDERLWEGLMEHYADGRCSRDKWDTGKHMDVVKLHVFLVANPKALDLLRLPEHRNVGLTVQKYLSWVYIPD